MGISPFHKSSYSTYDTPVVVEKIVEKPLPNPNPKNFRILNWTKEGTFLILLVEYPDCTNYEGKKILVYKYANIEDLLNQGSIDPHFSNNPSKRSPVARFVPTLDGWEMALKMARILSCRA